VKKPADITFDQAVSALASGLRPVVAVYVVVEALPGDSVLVVNDAITAKVAQAQGCEVFLLGSSDDPRVRSYGAEDLPEALLRETAGLGVKHILDFSKTQSAAHKSVMLQCLGLQGKWAVVDPRFQLDPPEATQLFLRSASVHFIFPEAWLFHGTAHGKFLLLMQLVLDKFRSGELNSRPRKLSSLKAFTAEEESIYKN
jgi:NADPH:quinone reductase-like Zn-dependent oxidoreductase